MDLEDKQTFCGDEASGGFFDARTALAANAPRIAWTNAQMGAYSAPAAGRVMFVNGDVDPWSSISATHPNALFPLNPPVEQDLNPANPSIWVVRPDGPNYANQTLTPSRLTAATAATTGQRWRARAQGV